MLPKKDGFAVCKELRRSGVQSPIILLTARVQEAERVLGLELGADDYVTKPFSPLELCARIKAVLRRTGRVDGGTDSARSKLTSPEDRRVAAPGNRSHRPRVQGARRPSHARGRLLSRAQIIDAAWGPGISITDRVVDNHILNLRRKLEADPATPRFLLNARGLGYRFESTVERLTES